MNTTTEGTMTAIKAMLEAEKAKLCFEYFNHKIGIKMGHEAATNRLIGIVEMYEKTITAIDWHIRVMQNEKTISMKEMCLALKVISDNYENPAPDKDGE